MPPLRAASFACLVTAALHGAPPGFESSVAVSIAGRASISSEISGARRIAIGKGWFASGGGDWENHAFSAVPLAPSRLQSIAARGALEYFVGDDAAISLTIRPGVYFAPRGAGARSFDAPCEFVSGLPLGKNLFGLIGAMNGRFYHEAVPITGVVWSPSPTVRLEMAYPEPAIVLQLSAQRSLRLGGRLAGGGYLSVYGGSRTPVEYSSYRLGLEYAAPARFGANWTCGAGCELKREFDFFRAGRREAERGNAYFSLRLDFASTK